MQRAFAGHMARTNDATYSAARAGYSQPASDGSQLMKIERVAEECRRRARNRLMTEGAEVGVSVLIELASDTKQKGSTRGAAAKALVQLSGVAGAQDLTEKDLSDMTPDELRSVLAAARAKLEERINQARTIEHEPAEEPESPQIAQAAPNEGVFD